MLNPGPIADAIVTTLKTITDLAAAMTVLDATGTSGGSDHRLSLPAGPGAPPRGSGLRNARAVDAGGMGGKQVRQLRRPTRFGSTVSAIYYRMGNAAGLATPVGYEDLWTLTCNGPTHRCRGQ